MQSMLGGMGTLASSTARAGHFLRDDITENRSTSSLFLISSLSRTLTSGRAGHTVTGTGRKKVIKNTTLQINSRSAGKRGYMNIHDRFIRDTWFRKSMFEMDRTEREVIREMDRFANDRPHPYCHRRRTRRISWQFVDTFEFCGFRHDADKASSLNSRKRWSTLHRLEKAEDKAYYHNWSQSSFSSWWQWQDSWWHPASDTSSRRWT